MNSTWLAGVDACRGGWIVAFVQPAGDEASVRVAAVLRRRARGAGGARRRCRRHADRAARARALWWASGRERGAAAARRTAVVGVLGAVAGGARGRRTIARPAGSRSRPPIRRAWSRSSCSCSRRKSARWTAACGLMRRPPRRGVRGASRGRVLAPQWRPRARSAEEGEGPLLRAGPRSCAAACCWTRAFRPPWSTARRPRAPSLDDLLDALACAAVARRIHAGVARPFPDPPERDAFGLPMAIWA